MAVLFAVRAGREDDTPRAELSGYQEYAREVRYRLLSGGMVTATGLGVMAGGTGLLFSSVGMPPGAEIRQTQAFWGSWRGRTAASTTTSSPLGSKDARQIWV